MIKQNNYYIVHTIMEVHEKEVIIVIHMLRNDKVKHGGKALHKFLRLILNPTSQVGYFSNA